MSPPASARREVTVNLENGLHLVPCSRIAEHCRDFAGRIEIANGDVSADARSVLDLITLKATKGTVLRLEAEGEDAETLLDGLVELFASNFDT